MTWFTLYGISVGDGAVYTAASTVGCMYLGLYTVHGLYFFGVTVVWRPIWVPCAVAPNGTAWVCCVLACVWCALAPLPRHCRTHWQLRAGSAVAEAVAPCGCARRAGGGRATADTPPTRHIDMLAERYSVQLQ